MVYVLLVLIAIAFCVGTAWGYAASKKALTSGRMFVLAGTWVVITVITMVITLTLMHRNYFPGIASALLAFFMPFVGPIFGRAVEEGVR
jgi:uncharacterized membrane protein YidH (DUF202 family)